MGLDPRSKSVTLGYLCATGESILFCDSYVSLCIYPPAGRRRPARSGSAVELPFFFDRPSTLRYAYAGFTVSSGRCRHTFFARGHLLRIHRSTDAALLATFWDEPKVSGGAQVHQSKAACHIKPYEATYEHK